MISKVLNNEELGNRLSKIKVTRLLFITFERLEILKRPERRMRNGYILNISPVGLKDCKDYVERLYELDIFKGEQTDDK